MINGLYRISQDGEVLATGKNIITSAGRAQILRYLAGHTNALGESIGVGVGAATPLSSDTRLTYELDRAKINVSSIDIVNNKVIWKGTLEQNTIGKIYEIGLYSSSALGDSKSLISFDQGFETWSNPNFQTANARVGADALRIAPATSTTATAVLSNIAMDLSAYSLADKFNLVYNNGNANAATIRIRFRAENTAEYYEYTFTPGPIGYNSLTFNKSNLTKVGNVDYSSIRSVEIAVTAGAGGAAQVDFDGLRIEDEDNVSTNQTLVSRALLSGVVTKTNLAPMDVEYIMEIPF